MFILTVKAIVVKNIHMKTLSGAPVTAMYNSTAVRSYSLSGRFWTLGEVQFADRAYPAIDCIDLDRCGFQVLGWSFPADCSSEINIRRDLLDTPKDFEPIPLDLRIISRVL